jgi:hypothetical protein
MPTDGRRTTEDGDQNQGQQADDPPIIFRPSSKHPKTVGAGGDSAPEPGEALVEPRFVKPPRIGPAPRPGSVAPSRRCAVGKYRAGRGPGAAFHYSLLIKRKPLASKVNSF